MILTFAGELTKMINAGLGIETVAPDTSVAVGRYSEYVEVSDAAVATFDTNAALPLRALTVDIEPIQEGTGDPSPENVRPISGRSEVGVWRSGVNVWDEEWVLGDISSITGAETTGDKVISKNYCSILPNTTYYNLSPSVGNQGIFFYDANKSFIEMRWLYAQTFTTPSTARFFKIRFPSQYGITYANNGGINYPSTDHDYHVSDIASITIPLGQTVYGGTVDAVSGVMTVDRAAVDMGSLNWNFQTSSGNMYADNALSNRLERGRTSCSMFKYVTKADGGEMAGVADLLKNNAYAFQHNLSARVIVRDTTYTDAATFKTAVTGQTLVYELAQPVTVQLTAQQLTTLLGTNNVWSDGGNVSLTYTKYNYTEGY